MDRAHSWKRWRSFLITVFVIVWTLVYHYMSVKHFYLEPIAKKPLPRVPMLFPPAGWIMFYNVGDEFGEIDVYGLQDIKLRIQDQRYYVHAKEYHRLDPHAIFRTRTIFFDNIKRGLIHGAVGYQKDFCDFLEFRFSYYDAFEVRYVGYPAMTKEPYRRVERVYYQCLTKHYQDNELNK